MTQSMRGAMFSGIVETFSRVNACFLKGEVTVLICARPPSFSDLTIGDSISVNGVCLTVEDFDSATIQFSLGPETLRITQWTPAILLNSKVNLERSLAIGSRIHGHWVTGHVDSMGRVVSKNLSEHTITLSVELPPQMRLYVWPKGSITINGCSLTINQFDDRTNWISLGLIPETISRTNLGDVEIGDLVTVEPDFMAKAAIHYFQQCQQDPKNSVAQREGVCEHN